MTNLSLLLVFILQLCLVKFSLTFEYSPVVQTTKGPVKGRVFTTVRESKRYHSYRGIPYGKPPVGYLKFVGPKEPDAWKEVFDASKEGNICPQIVNNKFLGDEDCLQLNVYTPQLPKNGTEPKAVICWIFGGAFTHGDNLKESYSPDYLIEEDVVVVSINYRLGALGFLALGHKNASGNAGLKDQSLALKWVHDNIHNFGGDPKKVTLLGVSAGSVSVGYQMLSEQSKDLFRSTILMSGVPLCYFAFDRPEKARSKAFHVARKLGFKGSSTKQLLEFYYHVDIQRMTEAVNNLTVFSVPLQPVLENANYVPDPFLSKCSLKKYTSGDFNHGPVMLGFTKDETLVYLNSKEGRKEIIDSVMAYAQKHHSSKQVNPFYSSTEVCNKPKKGKFTPTVLQFTSDVGFIAPIDYTQKLLSKFNDSVYYYQYKFDYNNSLHRILYGVDKNGSAHGDDVAMIFYSDQFKIDPKANNSITLLQKQMTRMWTNMAKYGNPTPNGTKDNLLNIVWPDSRSSGKMLWLDEKLEIHDRYQDPLVDIIENGIKHFGSHPYGCELKYTKKTD